MMVAIFAAIGIGSIFVGWCVNMAAAQIVDVLREIRDAVKKGGDV